MVGGDRVEFEDVALAGKEATVVSATKDDQIVVIAHKSVAVQRRGRLAVDCEDRRVFDVGS